MTHAQLLSIGSSDHHTKYTDAEAITAADFLKLNGETVFLDKRQAVTTLLWNGTTHLANSAGAYSSGTGSDQLRFGFDVPEWLERYIVENSKTLKITDVDLSFDNRDGGASSGISRVIVYHMNESEAYGSMADSIYDNSTGWGGGSIGKKSSSHDVTDTTIRPQDGDGIIVRVFVENDGTAAGIRIRTVQITWDIS